MSFKTYLSRGISYIIHGQPVVYNTVTANISSLSPNELLKDRTALITGGTSGIGLEMAISFINAGAFVVITGRDKVRLESACQRIRKETLQVEKIVSVVMDNRDVDTFNQKFIEILELTPNKQIDILVNNAGIIGEGCFGNIKSDVFDSVIGTNLKGVLFLSQIVAHHMKDNKIEGNILNIASSSSLRPVTQTYTLSKWGIRGLTLGMARMLAPHNIVVNGIAPGPTATPMLMHNKVDDNIYHEKLITGRYATPEEIANMGVILVSNMSRMIIGDIIYMTGGAGILTNDDMNYSFT